jgi:hypothetical protein
MLWRLKQVLWLLPVILVLGTAAHAAQQNPKRLILKDGSYQSATKWEITGDRVRYFSAERYAWEELPKDLVDWPATDKYNQEHERQRTINAEEVKQQEEADQRAQEAATPTVAPGLRLPDGGGIFLLDVYRGRSQLVELAQNGGEVNKQTGKNILRAALNPLALSSKQTIQIGGQHAQVQAHELQPAIFVNVDSVQEVEGGKEDDDKGNANVKGESSASPGPAAAPLDRYRIIRLEPKKDSRVVGNLSVAVYGKISQKENWIPSSSSQVGDWVKVTPAAPLQPGEYALAEMLDAKQINIYVWDFGVNPDAPQNASSWVSKPNPTPSKDQNPGLEKRTPQ